jgi:hypothetical protein
MRAWLAYILVSCHECQVEWLVCNLASMPSLTEGS